MQSIIQPFYGIRPHEHTNYSVANNLLYCSSEDTNPINDFNKKAHHIEKLYKNMKLHKDSRPCFYAYRSISNLFISVGLIAKINTKFIGKNIFPHEEVIKDKSNIYAFSLRDRKIQINPVILIHDHITEAEHHLQSLIANNKPLISMKKINHSHEIWPIYEDDIIKKAYSSLETLLIADGHHRLDSFAKLSNIPFFMALLISTKHLYPQKILRKYIYLTAQQNNVCLDFFINNFNLKIIENYSQLNSLNKFIIFSDKKILIIDEEVNNLLIGKILSFLDANINYDANGTLNFENHPLSDVTSQEVNNISLSSQFSIIIPSIKFNEFEINGCYPPHSTWFEPKLIDGLISMIL